VKTFTRALSLINVSHGGAGTACPLSATGVCGKKPTVNWKALHEHVLVKHIGYLKHECKRCHKRFAGWDQIARHRRTIHHEAKAAVKKELEEAFENELEEQEEQQELER